jgi:hypothetical protein
LGLVEVSVILLLLLIALFWYFVIFDLLSTPFFSVGSWSGPGGGATAAV